MDLRRYRFKFLIVYELVNYSEIEMHSQWRTQEYFLPGSWLKFIHTLSPNKVNNDFISKEKKDYNVYNLKFELVNGGSLGSICNQLSQYPILK